MCLLGRGRERATGGVQREVALSASLGQLQRRRAPGSTVLAGDPALGFDQQAIDLSVYGLSGCVGLTTPNATFFYTTDAAGYAEHQNRVGNYNSLIGFNIYCQWYLWDPQSNPVGLITSNAVRGTIGDH